ncbi:MAG: phosphatase PAP2 family protein [Candidatus Paceibacterota bacterium]|jgi:undecaprenyl-diphosphatase
MNPIDQAILDFFTHYRVDSLVFVMLIITYTGSSLVVGGLTLLSAISFYIHKHTSNIIPLLITIGGSTITTYLIKHIVDRARPLGAIYTELSPSFPSGHATTAMALYGFMIYTIWSQSTKTSRDEHRSLHKFLTAGLVILILLIGLSRLYLGVHYFSDVLVGFFIGLIWILISRSIAKSKFWRLLVGEHL